MTMTKMMTRMTMTMRTMMRLKMNLTTGMKNRPQEEDNQEALITEAEEEEENKEDILPEARKEDENAEDLKTFVSVPDTLPTLPIFAGLLVADKAHPALNVLDSPTSLPVDPSAILDATTPTSPVTSPVVSCLTSMLVPRNVRWYRTSTA
jgi:hypothetical protein